MFVLCCVVSCRVVSFFLGHGELWPSLPTHPTQVSHVALQASPPVDLTALNNVVHQCMDNITKLQGRFDQFLISHTTVQHGTQISPSYVLLHTTPIPRTLVCELIMKLKVDAILCPSHFLPTNLSQIYLSALC